VNRERIVLLQAAGDIATARISGMTIKRIKRYHARPWPLKTKE
jgi:hypothetical protein